MNNRYTPRFFLVTAIIFLICALFLGTASAVYIVSRKYPVSIIYMTLSVLHIKLCIDSFRTRRKLINSSQSSR
jgi:hypothetical protein